jgi:uncharacterized protein
MDPWLLTVGFLVAALLYASVGHGGASGYLALMALAQFAPAHMRPLALTMNIGVAALAAWHYRAYLQPQLMWRLILLSVPLAYLGGLYRLSESSYSLVLGTSLMAAALWLWLPIKYQQATRTLPSWLALIAGAALGLLAGLTGIGVAPEQE